MLGIDGMLSRIEQSIMMAVMVIVSRLTVMMMMMVMLHEKLLALMETLCGQRRN